MGEEGASESSSGSLAQLHHQGYPVAVILSWPFTGETLVQTPPNSLHQPLRASFACSRHSLVLVYGSIGLLSRLSHIVKMLRVSILLLVTPKVDWRQASKQASILY